MKVMILLCVVAAAGFVACSGSTDGTETTSQPAAAPTPQSDTQPTGVPATSEQGLAPVPGSGQGGAVAEVVVGEEVARVPARAFLPRHPARTA